MENVIVNGVSSTGIILDAKGENKKTLRIPGICTTDAATAANHVEKEGKMISASLKARVIVLEDGTENRISGRTKLAATIAASEIRTAFKVPAPAPVHDNGKGADKDDGKGAVGTGAGKGKGSK